MKIAKLLHNPTAGDEEHDKDDLIALIQNAGFECRYASVKGWFWDSFEKDIDFLIAAGGDGTVRKLTKELLDRKVLDKSYPIALLPLGTANNISKTLHIEGKTKDIIWSWHHSILKKYDVGKISGVEKASFFLESFGFGLFPYLMKQMKNQEKEAVGTPRQALQTALKVLQEILLNYEPKECTLMIDGKDYSGKYLLVEVMNIRSIGPNLFLSRDGDPGDGIMEVVVLPEEDKEKFEAYLTCKINGDEVSFDFRNIKAKNVVISWNGTHVHADDETLKCGENKEITIEVKPGLLEFMVPR